MVITADGGVPLLVVLARTGGMSNITVVDVDTSDSFSISLEDSVSKTILQTTASGPEVVFHGDSTLGVHFLAIEGVAKEKGRNCTVSDAFG